MTDPGSGSDDDYRAEPYDRPFTLADFEQPALDLGLEELSVVREGPHDCA